jgi:hypothetical protein
VRDANQLAPPVAFFHLAVDQTSRHLPLSHSPPATTRLASQWPKWAVRAEKYKFNPSLVKSGIQKGGQDVSQGVDDAMRGVLRAGTQMQDGKKLCARVDDKPEPRHLFGATEPCAQFVQLEVREVEMAEEALMQGLRVLESRARARW